jgi:hypothetical protein
MQERDATTSATTTDGWGWLLLFLAAGGAINGIWMLVDPAHWYHHLPAGVPDTGPLNAHFVRDIGCAFLALSLALFWAWRVPLWRTPLVVTTALFYVAHAILHVHDVARGLLESDHLLLDAWGVYAPAVLISAAALHYLRVPSADQRPGPG